MHVRTRYPQVYPQPSERFNGVMQMWAQLLVGFAVISSLAALCAAWYALARAETIRLLAVEARQQELEIEVQSLRNAYESTKESMKRINSRYAMREKRARDKANGAGDVPDPETDPEGWRQHMQTKYPRGVFDYGRG